MKGKNNPVAKFAARMNYNAGVHEKSNKAKRKANKQQFVTAMRSKSESYFISLFMLVG